jgi:hypothetical protein
MFKSLSAPTGFVTKPGTEIPRDLEDRVDLVDLEELLFLLAERLLELLFAAAMFFTLSLGFHVRCSR